MALNLLERLGLKKQKIAFPKNYRWEKGEGRAYSLIIDDTSEMILSRHAKGKKGKYEPYSKRERKVMWNPEVEGPKEPFFLNTILTIAKHHDIDGFLPQYVLYLLNGEFQYCERHDPGLGDIRSIEKGISTIEEFRDEMEWYWQKGYWDFADFFRNSNLPEDYKKSVSSISSCKK